MIRPTLEHIYDAFKQAVMYYPVPSNGWKCLQPQSFAVLESRSVLNTENLAKTPCDRLKPFFFSRLWLNKKYNPSDLSFDWPLVAIFEQSGTVNNLNFATQTNEYNIQVVVLDQYKDDCTKGSCQGCSGRVKNEIFTHTEEILFNILSYFKELEFVKLASGEWKLVNKALYNILKETEGLISEHDSTLQGNKIATAISRLNSNAATFRVDDYSTSNLWGSGINLTLSVPYCHTHVYDFSSIDKGIIHDIGCC